MRSAKLFFMVWLFLHVMIDSIVARKNTSTLIQEWLKGCPDVYFRCGQDKRQTCKCDEVCHQYTDCCSDAPSVDMSLKEHRLDGYISLSSCNPVESSDKSTIGAFMVSRCGEKWPNDDIRENCENEKHVTLLEMLPVFDIETFLTFKNQYCAICNGLSDWFGWNLRLDCKQQVLSETQVTFTDTIYQAINSSQCDFKFISPYPEFSRDCHLALQYSTRTPEEETVCATGMLEPILLLTKTREIIARNKQCLEKKMLDINETDILIIYCLVQNQGQNDLFSLTTILDYSSLITRLEDSRTQQCDEMDIFMSDLDGCQELLCPAGFHPNYGECVSNGLDTDIVLDFLLEFKPRNNRQLIEAVVEKIFSSYGEQYVFNRHHHTVHAFSGVDSSVNISCSFLHVVLPLLLSPSANDWKQSLIQKIKTCSFLIDGHIRVECIEGVENRTCTSNATIANPKFQLPILSSYYGRDLPCAAVELDFLTVNKTIGNTTNGSNDWFSLKSTSTRIDTSHVLKVDNEFYLCISTYQEFYLSPPKQLTTLDTHVRFFVNMACNCISILSTICLLCHYYKNILGTRISMPFVVLLIFLLVQQCQFLFISLWPNIYKGSVCVWLGSVHHFTWMSTFSFMFISLLRLHADITSLENHTDMISLQNIKSLAFGFAIPAVITFVAKLSEQVTTSTDLWYGGNFCFINNPSILLCTFIIPMILFLFANLVVFCLIINYIRKTTNRIRHTNNLGIYLRISSTLGFTWIIGVINGMVNTEVLAWIFEITTNLQGFAIMLGFMCNKRTILAYKESYLTWKGSKSITVVSSSN